FGFLGCRVVMLVVVVTRPPVWTPPCLSGAVKALHAGWTKFWRGNKAHLRLARVDEVQATQNSVRWCRHSMVGLTRHKISDGWRERLWLQVEGCSYPKLSIGTASRSLHRVVRWLACVHHNSLIEAAIARKTTTQNITGPAPPLNLR